MSLPSLSITDRIKFFPFRKYYPLNHIEISKENLLANYYYLSSLEKNIRIAPVLKSNAYGHGLVQIAKVLDSVGAPFFCVDSIHEAYALFKAKIKTPILIMGYIDPRNLQTKNLPFSFVVYTKELLFAIKKYQPQASIHVFVDTGMHREGLAIEDLPEFIQLIKSLSMKIEGLLSHLAMSDKPENADTKRQIANFAKAKEILLRQGIKPIFTHIAASQGLLTHTSYKNKLGNVSRCGIALYGISHDTSQLKPVLQLTSTIVQIKQLKKGEKVGYDFTYTTRKNMRIAVLPLGFNDGLEKKLSNVGYVLVQGVPCRIIGRVSMNITVIDVTEIVNVKVGNTAIVYSNNTTQKNTINETALLANLTPYEILIHLTSSTKRVIST